MAFFAPIGLALGATTSAGLVGASVALGVAGTAIQTISAVQQGKFQAAVLERQAQLNEQQAKQVIRAGNETARDTDLEAGAIMSDVLAKQGSSGFQTNSGSFLRRRTGLKVLAARDRIRTVTDSQIQARGLRENAAIQRAQADAAKPSSLTYLAAGLGVADSLIGGATLATSLNARKVTRTASTI